MSEKSAAQQVTSVRKRQPERMLETDSLLPTLSDAVRRGRGAPHLLTSAQVLTLQRTIGNQAVQRLLRGEPSSPAHSAQPKALQRMADLQPTPAISSAPGNVIQPARYLMNFATFENRKDAATTRESPQQKRSTAGVKKIYEAYDNFVRTKRYMGAEGELTNLKEKINRMYQKDYWVSDDARNSLIDDMWDGIEWEEYWLAHQHRAITGGAQALGQPKAGVTPVDQRPKGVLTMGQGVAVDLGQMILYSDEFSSCMPVVMFNEGTRMGGLFHFPATDLKGQKNNLRAMYNQVQPTEIYLNDRSYDDGMMKVTITDAADLQNFFEGEVGYTGSFYDVGFKADRYSITLDGDGGVQIAGEIATDGPTLNATRDRTGDERIRLEEQWQDAPSATKFGRDDWNND